MQKSAPLRNRNSPSDQRLVPIDPLDDVPKPKGFPDGPPPKPRDPLDDIFGRGTYSKLLTNNKHRLLKQYFRSLLDALFADRFFGRNDFSKIFPGQKGQNDNKQEKKMDDLTRPSLSNFDLGGPTSGRLTDTDLLLGMDL